jgi:hypothetical protein
MLVVTYFEKKTNSTVIMELCFFVHIYCVFRNKALKITRINNKECIL